MKHYISCLCTAFSWTEAKKDLPIIAFCFYLHFFLPSQILKLDLNIIVVGAKCCFSIFFILHFLTWFGNTSCCLHCNSISWWMDQSKRSKFLGKSSGSINSHSKLRRLLPPPVNLHFWRYEVLSQQQWWAMWAMNNKKEELQVWYSSQTLIKV